jgi:hypothetical protein
MMSKVVATTCLFFATSGATFAVFDIPPPPNLPEPATAALIAAGALAVGGVRYLTKRKHDKK